MEKKTYMMYRVSYSKARDSFSTWVYVGNERYPSWDDFGLELECYCVRAYIEDEGIPTDEPDFVSYKLVTHIRQAMRLGYTVQFMDRPEGDE